MTGTSPLSIPCQYLKQLLGHYFEVTVATDGKAALEIVSRESETLPDLIVSDIMMPIMNGYELTRQLRNSVQTAIIPIILLTALNSITRGQTLCEQKIIANFAA